MEKKNIFSIKSIGTKALIVLIALSFALWGVGDIFISNTNPTIAKVGNEKIKLNEFRLEYNIILDRLRKASKEPLTDEFVKAMGLQNNVLDNIMTQKYINLVSNELGIDINEKYLRKSIYNNPLFIDQIGVFNRDYFNYYLNQNSISEKELLEISKELLKNDIFLQSINIGNLTPDSITENFVKKRDMVRKAEIYIFNQSNVLFNKVIDDIELKKKYDEVKNNFLTAEERDIEIIKINSKGIKRNINIEDELVEQVFQSNKNAYVPEEERSVYQHIIKNKEQADVFYNELKKDGNFFSVLDKNGIDKDDISLGKIKKGNFSKELDNIIFNLKEKEFSKLFKSSFGYKIVYVDEIIKPEKINELEIKKIIKKDLVAQQLDNELYEKANKIYDDFIINKDLSKIRKEPYVESNKIKNISLNNIDKIYKIIKSENLSKDDLSKNIFNLKENEITDTIEDDDNSIYFIHVDKIRKSKVKNFDEIKTDLIEIIYNDKRRELARKEANSFADRTTREGKVSASKYELIKTNWITSDSRLGKEIEDLIKKAIFSTKLNTFSEVNQLDAFTFFVVRPVKQKEDYLKDKVASNKSVIGKNIFNSINTDIINATLKDLKETHRSEVSENFLKSF